MSEARAPHHPALSPPPAPVTLGERSAKNPAVIALPALSPYRHAYYCPRCERWVPHEEALAGPGGRPLCPRCHRPLRTKARKRIKGWEFRGVNVGAVPREGERR